MTYNTENALDEFNRTGEAWLLNQLSSLPLTTIFDVGSNQGEWTKLARQSFPLATIHTFEIMPETYRKFLNNGTLDINVVPNGFGLGSFTGTIPMKYCAFNDTFNTHLRMLAPGSMENMEFEWRDCLVIKGDEYVKAHKVDHIDILKIDVEGAEPLVLDGFNNFIKNGNIGLIQFEYGTANIIARWLLVDAYELLTPLGYVLGRLQDGGVTFQPYNLTMENFFGPNFIAVHQSRKDLLTALGAVC
jgi:FkbM family methyltransferase